MVLTDLGVNLSGIVGTYDVLGINTNSRALPSGEAYRRVRGGY
jgi:uncharacterized protein YgbK (DUF1537 family)